MNNRKSTALGALTLALCLGAGLFFFRSGFFSLSSPEQLRDYILDFSPYSHLAFFLIQLFFDNEDFFRFLERCRIAGINVPIEAGIMPVLSKSSIQRMVSMCGASMPRKLTRILARYGDHPDALMEAGIAYAIDQIADLIAGGVDGIHLYTMNNPAVAHKIADSISSIRRV